LIGRKNAPGRNGLAIACGRLAPDRKKRGAPACVAASFLPWSENRTVLLTICAVEAQTSFARKSGPMASPDRTTKKDRKKFDA
jgi:hypothetical protein